MSSASRYAAVGTATWTAPDGTQVPYLLRRFLPQIGQFATLRTYQVRPGDRVDVIAYTQLGDPELSWLLADANPVSLAERPEPAWPHHRHSAARGRAQCPVTSRSAC